MRIIAPNTIHLALYGLLAAPLTACSIVAGDQAQGSDGGESAGSASGGGDTGGASGGDGGLNPGVGQGGAQDFGLFRQILLAGEIPGPDTIDDVGFFNEHKLLLPAADCGHDVCLHGLFGQMGNMITGSNCTTVLLGMNTPIDPETIPRRPLNLALAIDVSGSMRGDPIDYTRLGLTQMLGSLLPEDRITIVAFSEWADVVADGLAGDDPELQVVIEQLDADGGTNIYDGLRAAFEAVDAAADNGMQNRVILLSDGVATEGITASAKILNMAAAYNAAGLNLTTIGLGEDFDVQLMRTLAEAGSGAFYFLEDPKAVAEVFVEEVEAFLIPLAEDASINFGVTGDYILRGLYGTKLFTADGQGAEVEIPSLQIAHRKDVDDNDKGRRGGGGAILLELLPAPGAGAGAQEVGDLHFSYRVPASDVIIEQEIAVTAPLGPGEPGTFFADASVEKSFVMLNIFMGFKMAALRAQGGDDLGAINLLNALAANVQIWLEQNPDADIEDDLFYIDLFRTNIHQRTPQEPQPNPPPEPWPYD